MTETDDEQLPLAVASLWMPTDDIRVDSAVEMVELLRDIPVSDHQQVFEDVYGRLQQTLADASGQ